jgi:hypothetical protein
MMRNGVWKCSPSTKGAGGASVSLLVHFVFAPSSNSA